MSISDGIAPGRVRNSLAIAVSLLVLASCTTFIVPREARDAIAGAEDRASACGASPEQIQAAWSVYGDFLSAHGAIGIEIPRDADLLLPRARAAALAVSPSPAQAADAAAEAARVRFYAEAALEALESRDLVFAYPSLSEQVGHEQQDIDALDEKIASMRRAYSVLSRSYSELYAAIQGEGDGSGTRSRIEGILVASGTSLREAARAAAAAASVDVRADTAAAVAAMPGVDSDEAFEIAAALDGFTLPADGPSPGQILERARDDDAVRTAVVQAMPDPASDEEREVAIARLLRDLPRVSSLGLSGHSEALVWLEASVLGALVDSGTPDRRAASLARAATRAAVSTLEALGQDLLVAGPDPAYVAYRSMVDAAKSAADGDSAVAERAARARVESIVRQQRSVGEHVLATREQDILDTEAANRFLAQRAYRELVNTLPPIEGSPDEVARRLDEAAQHLHQECVEGRRTEYSPAGARVVPLSPRPSAERCEIERTLAVPLLESYYRAGVSASAVRSESPAPEALLARALEESHLAPFDEDDWAAWRERVAPEIADIARRASAIGPAQPRLRGLSPGDTGRALRPPAERAYGAIAPLAPMTIGDELGDRLRDARRLYEDRSHGALEFRSDPFSDGVGALELIAQLELDDDYAQRHHGDMELAIVDKARRARDLVAAALQVAERRLQGLERSARWRDRYARYTDAIDRLSQAAFDHYEGVCREASEPAVTLMQVTPQQGLNPFDPRNPVGTDASVLEASGGGGGGTTNTELLLYEGSYNATYTCTVASCSISEQYIVLTTISAQFRGNPIDRLRLFIPGTGPFIPVEGPFTAVGTNVTFGPLVGSGMLLGQPVDVQISGQLTGAPGAPTIDAQITLTSGPNVESFQVDGTF